MIEREAAASAYALVLEPAAGNGACVTARKGVGRFRMEVEGKASHSGAAFLDGASAVVEFAHQIVRIDGLVDLGQRHHPQRRAGPGRHKAERDRG